MGRPACGMTTFSNQANRQFRSIIGLGIFLEREFLITQLTS